MDTLPAARTADIVVQELGRECLIYDLNTHRAYSLNETSATVYQSCDGKTTVEELKRKHKFTDDLIHLALDQLREENLIEDGNFFVSPFAGIGRREAIRKAGLASMIALPVISSLVAPTAAAAQSGGGGAPAGTGCSVNSECASNNCAGVCCASTGTAPFGESFNCVTSNCAASCCSSEAAARCCSGTAITTACSEPIASCECR